MHLVKYFQCREETGLISIIYCQKRNSNRGNERRTQRSKPTSPATGEDVKVSDSLVTGVDSQRGMGGGEGTVMF